MLYFLQKDMFLAKQDEIIKYVGFGTLRIIAMHYTEIYLLNSHQHFGCSTSQSLRSQNF